MTQEISSIPKQYPENLLDLKFFNNQKTFSSTNNRY